MISCISVSYFVFGPRLPHRTVGFCSLRRAPRRVRHVRARRSYARVRRRVLAQLDQTLLPSTILSITDSVVVLYKTVSKHIKENHRVDELESANAKKSPSNNFVIDCIDMTNNETTRNHILNHLSSLLGYTARHRAILPRETLNLKRPAFGDVQPALGLVLTALQVILVPSADDGGIAHRLIHEPVEERLLFRFLPTLSRARASVRSSSHPMHGLILDSRLAKPPTRSPRSRVRARSVPSPSRSSLDVRSRHARAFARARARARTPPKVASSSRALASRAPNPSSPRASPVETSLRARANPPSWIASSLDRTSARATPERRLTDASPTSTRDTYLLHGLLRRGHAFGPRRRRRRDDGRQRESHHRWVRASTSDEDGGARVDDVARDRDRSTRTTATSTTTTIWECRVLGVIGRAARARTMGERDVEYGIGRSRARVCSSTSRVVIYFS